MKIVTIPMINCDNEAIIDKELIYLGSFYTEEEAARVYDEHAKIYFGDLACLNFKGGKCE